MQKLTYSLAVWALAAGCITDPGPRDEPLGQEASNSELIGESNFRVTSSSGEALTRGDGRIHVMLFQESAVPRVEIGASGQSQSAETWSARFVVDVDTLGAQTIELPLRNAPVTLGSASASRGTFGGVSTAATTGTISVTLAPGTMRGAVTSPEVSFEFEGPYGFDCSVPAALVPNAPAVPVQVVEEGEPPPLPVLVSDQARESAFCRTFFETLGR